MRAADSRDVGRMSRSGQPVMDRGADTTPLDGSSAWAMVAGNEQNDALAAGDCLVEITVDCHPRRIEIHAVKVERSVGFNQTAPQLLVPASVESLLADRDRLWRVATKPPS
jgi:hypothetical protein